RRHFIGAAAAAAVLCVPVAAPAQQKMVIKASDVHPLGYPTVEAIVRMGAKLEKATNGRLTLQMYPQMQLGGEKEMIEQAQVGALQIARISVGALGPVINELYSAMQTGVVDGAENNEPTVLAQNHYQVAKIYSLTGHLIIPEMFVFSKVSWDKLGKDDQALIKKYSRETQMEQRQLWDEKT